MSASSVTSHAESSSSPATPPVEANRVAASFILLLLFASLVVFYVAVPQSVFVTILSVLILAVGMIIASIGNYHTVRAMSVLAALVSIATAYFSGVALTDNMIVGWVAAVVWALVLLSVFRWIMDSTINVPEDHALMFREILSDRAIEALSSGVLPAIPGIQRHVATIPKYEITHDIKVENINTNTPAGFNIDLVVANVHFRVVEPNKALGGIPNRGNIQNQVAREMGKDLNRARLDVAFWENLLKRQMEHDLDDIVRDVCFLYPAQLPSRTPDEQRQMSEQQLYDQLRSMLRTQALFPKEPPLIAAGKNSMTAATPPPAAPTPASTNDVGKPADEKKDASNVRAPSPSSEQIKTLNDLKMLGPVDAYKHRRTLSTEVHARLAEEVERWGVTIDSLALNYYKVDGERFRFLIRDQLNEGETRQRTLEMIREANRMRITMAAEAEMEGQRVAQLVKALRESGVELTPEMLQVIVKSALWNTEIWQEENEFVPYPPDVRAKSMPPARPPDRR